MSKRNSEAGTVKLRRSRLNGEQTLRLLEHFVVGTPARTAAEIAGVNRNTATHFFHHLRELIASQLELPEPVDAECAVELEVDESCFSGVGSTNRVRSSGGKLMVVGLLQRGGKVRTVLLPDARRELLLPILKGMIAADSTVYAEKAHVHHALEVLGFHPRRIDRARRFAGGRVHIRGIENFWRQANRHLRKYNGIPHHHFHLYLKECEWRFNYGPPKQLLAILRDWVRRT